MRYLHPRHNFAWCRDRAGVFESVRPCTRRLMRSALHIFRVAHTHRLTVHLIVVLPAVVHVVRLRGSPDDREDSPQVSVWRFRHKLPCADDFDDQSRHYQGENGGSLSVHNSSSRGFGYAQDYEKRALHQLTL